MHGQMSSRQLSPVTYGLINLPMQFGEDLVSKKWDAGPQTLSWSGGRPAGLDKLVRYSNRSCGAGVRGCSC